MGALATYQFRTQRLLHDANAKFYPLADLNDYINQARQRVVRDSGCLRSLQTALTLTANQETYSVSSFLTNGANTVDILGITVYWGNSRIALLNYPWSEFNVKLRYWQNYRGRPAVFSRYGAQTVYIGPVPDQNYVSDWDTVVLPADLPDDDSGTETIPVPFQTPVPFYAAYLAKFYEQSFGESSVFEQQYNQQMGSAQASWMRATVYNPYRET